MSTYKINELYGDAYNAAINNVISTVNKLGWCWDYFENWRDAQQMAEETEMRFTCNGEFSN